MSNMTLRMKVPLLGQRATLSERMKCVEVDLCIAFLNGVLSAKAKYGCSEMGIILGVGRSVKMSRFYDIFGRCHVIRNDRYTANDLGYGHC